jgi:G:T-mismatch repair DNA endonuclease (very short patch repair protein)
MATIAFIMSDSVFIYGIDNIMNNICPECSSVVTPDKRNRSRKFCNSSCANKNKAKQYGSPFSKLEVQQKAKQTLTEKYGVDNVFKLKNIQEKIVSNKDYSKIIPKTVQTTKQRHGQDFYKNKWKDYNQKNIPKDIIEKLLNKDWLNEQHQKYSLSSIAEQLNVSFTMVWQYARQHNIETRKHKETSIEIKFENFLIENNIEYRKNDRKELNGKELDFYLPQYSLGIELHGLYWHSSKFHYKNFLRNKYNLAQSKNIRLIQFTEYDIKTKFEIVKSIVLNICNKFSRTIYSRKCQLSIIDNNVASQFYEKNHIQGPYTSKHNIDLLYNGEIVSVMSFSKSRFSKKYDYELTRFCSLLNHKVIGAGSKLFKHFLREIKKPTSIVSYSDMQYFTGELYGKLSFICEKITAPNYSYLVNNKLVSRMNFQKKHIKRDHPDADLNENEEFLVLKHYGYYRFYHVGQRVHVWLP